jgi:uncharacterized membrane protein (UPF0127 family)
MATNPQQIINLTRNRVVCEHAVVADRMLRRMRGLLGRSELPPGEGILLTPAPSVHTAFMRFAIDIVFLDRDLRVIKIAREVPPWRATGAKGARSVLELPAGDADRLRLAIGDELGFSQSGRRLIGDPGPLAAPPALEDAHETTLADVLVIGDDRRFRSVAAALLERRGLSVRVCGRSAKIVALAAHEDPAVVVIDASGSTTGAADEIAHITELLPGVGIVVVDDEPSGGLVSMSVLAKWGDFDSLVAAIENARSLRIRSRAA